jgi:hypothetical protein
MYLHWAVDFFSRTRKFAMHKDENSAAMTGFHHRAKQKTPWHGNKKLR